MAVLRQSEAPSEVEAVRNSVVVMVVAKALPELRVVARMGSAQSLYLPAEGPHLALGWTACQARERNGWVVEQKQTQLRVADYRVMLLLAS